MTRRRIAVVTGSRAEYGLLRWLLDDIVADDSLELSLIATGMHVSTEFGLTYRSIEADGFQVERVPILLASDEPVAITKSVGVALMAFADLFERLQPEIVVVLGDRFELLAVAQAALLMRIPIAHLHGGETSVGAIDESIRHAITKMSSLHFVAAEPYRRRVVQMGENPAHVYHVGTPGLDVLLRATLPGRDAIEADVGLSLRSPSFLITYHPATLGARSSAAAIADLFGALDRHPNANIVFTRANADAEGRAINAAIDNWAAAHQDRVVVHTSLGQIRYLATMRCVDAVIGNSSSGLIEAPAMRVPTVNIGPRQDGRLRAVSVVDSKEDAGSIAAAITLATSAGHRAKLATMPPYGDACGASARIRDVLRDVDLRGIVRKKFFDLPFEEATRGA